MSNFRTLLLAAISAISIANAAKADVACNVTDTQGNRLTYLFGVNTENTNGTFGGTMVETGFEKNGTMTMSEVGIRPIWVFTANQGGGYNLNSRVNPGWTMSVVGYRAMLTHNGNFIAGGRCAKSDRGVDQNNVGDQGQTSDSQ
jgi:hypothetical protein